MKTFNHISATYHSLINACYMLALLACKITRHLCRHNALEKKSEDVLSFYFICKNITFTYQQKTKDYLIYLLVKLCNKSILTNGAQRGEFLKFLLVVIIIDLE